MGFSLGIFGLGSSHGKYRLGSSAGEFSLVNVHSGTFTPGSFTWEISLRICRSGTFAWQIAMAASLLGSEAGGILGLKQGSQLTGAEGA